MMQLLSGFLTNLRALLLYSKRVKREVPDVT